MLSIQTDFGEDYRRYFAKRFIELGGEVLSEDSSPIGDNDFRTEVFRIKKKSPDVVLLAHLGNTLGVLLRQLKQQGVDAQFLGVYEAQELSVLNVAGDAASGMIFFSPEPKISSSYRIGFIQRFVQRYGYQPSVLAANAYDTTILAAIALSECRLDSNCAQRFVLNANYDGVSGEFIVEADGGVSREFVAKTVSHGEFVKFELGANAHLAR